MLPFIFCSNFYHVKFRFKPQVELTHNTYTCIFISILSFYNIINISLYLFFSIYINRIYLSDVISSNICSNVLLLLRWIWDYELIEQSLDRNRYTDVKGNCRQKIQIYQNVVMQLSSFMNRKRGIEIFENEKCQKFEAPD